MITEEDALANAVDEIDVSPIKSCQFLAIKTDSSVISSEEKIPDFHANVRAVYLAEFPHTCTEVD